MSWERGRCREATSTEEHDTLLEKEATVEQPIASDRLYEGLILGRGFSSGHLFSPFHSGGTRTARGARWAASLLSVMELFPHNLPDNPTADVNIPPHDGCFGGNFSASSLQSG
jgi:hypothetical protein